MSLFFYYHFTIKAQNEVPHNFKYITPSWCFTFESGISIGQDSILSLWNTESSTSKWPTWKDIGIIILNQNLQSHYYLNINFISFPIWSTKLIMGIICRHFPFLTSSNHSHQVSPTAWVIHVRVIHQYEWNVPTQTPRCHGYINSDPKVAKGQASTDESWRWIYIPIKVGLFYMGK